MAKVLSLMATHTGDRSQYNRSVAEIDDQLTKNEENKKYTGAPFSRCGHRLGSQAMCSKGADMFAGVPNKRCGPKVHRLSCREKCTHVGKLMFGPWYLVRQFLILWFWSVVSHLKY